MCGSEILARKWNYAQRLEGEFKTKKKKTKKHKKTKKQKNTKTQKKKKNRKQKQKKKQIWRQKKTDQAYKITPKLHKSALFWYPLDFLNTSGAT